MFCVGLVGLSTVHRKTRFFFRVNFITDNEILVGRTEYSTQGDTCWVGASWTAWSEVQNVAKSWIRSIDGLLSPLRGAMNTSKKG